MKFTKWVNVETEIEIDVSSEDISEMLSENLDEEHLVRALNSIANFLNALNQQHISILTSGQRELIADYLSTQAHKFLTPDSSGAGENQAGGVDAAIENGAEDKD
jgi:hypothetical protein